MTLAGSRLSTLDSRSLLILGNDGTPEMAAVTESLSVERDAGEVRRAADGSAAVRLINQKNWFPELVLVCQNWPDEFAKSEVNELLERLPLSRWICCFGVWCESDGRNRDVWPAAIRVPARTAGPRIRRELAVLRGEHKPLPLTASRDEIFGYDRSDHLSIQKSRFSVRVNSRDCELCRWLQDLLRHAGYRLAALDDFSDAVLWDADPLCEAVIAGVRAERSQHPDVAIVALMSFAHPENVASLRSAGADAVIAKLTPHTELLEALSAALEQKRSVQPQ